MSVAPDSSRKRLRSRSSSTASLASSSKRATSEDTSLAATPPPSSLLSAATQDIDAYMATQNDLSLEPMDISSPAPASHPPSREQYNQIQALLQPAPIVGTQWFVVSKSWYEKWADACLGRVSKTADPIDALALIGPVDNSKIYAGPKEPRKILPDLESGTDFEVVPSDAWALFEQWYGASTTPIPVQVIQSGSAVSIEIYPPVFTVWSITSAQFPPKHISLSRAAKLQDLYNQVFRGTTRCEVWQIDIPRESETDDTEDVEVDAEFFETATRRKLLSNPPLPLELETTIQDAQLSDGDDIVLPLRLKSTSAASAMSAAISASVAQTSAAITPPKAPPPPPIFNANGSADYFTTLQSSTSTPASTISSSPSTPYLSNRNTVAKVTPSRMRGTVGLNNLGNTCFMNSALQCLAHIPELTNYFLSGAYSTELNPDNPLSTGGALAKAYGDLLSTLFSPSTGSSIAPREFKFRIATHAPAFSGYAQHDSQELLAFLLDGLHEDVNRVLKKPYVEKPDWEGGGLKEIVKLANDTWDGYMKRNDSVIVDMFQGQYKSTLVCPECSKVSITFDPFMYLTLPLPIHKTWTHEVHFVPWDNTKPHIKVKVTVPVNTSIRTLKQLLGKWFNAPPANLLAADVFSHRIFKYYSDHESATDISDNDVTVVWELPVPVPPTLRTPKEGEPPLPFIIPVFHLKPIEKSNVDPRTVRRGLNTQGRNFGIPTFVVLENQNGTAPSVQDIYNAVVDRYARWTSRATDLFSWQHASSPLPSTAPEAEEIPIIVDAHSSSSESPVDISSSTSSFTTLHTSEAADLSTSSLSPTTPAIPPTIISSNGLPSPAPEPDTVPVPMDVEDSTEDDIVVVGRKPNLFRMRLFATDEEYIVTGYSMDTRGGKEAEWPVRETAATEKASLPGRVALNHNDVIQCEWDGLMLDYFLGEGGEGSEESKWKDWESIVDPDTAEAAAKEAALNPSSSSSSSSFSAQKKKNTITLEDCLNEFTKEEKLGEDDLWYCPQCKKHQQATKQFEIWKVPDVLVVHLKRFSNSRSLRDKIDVLVEFPIEGLDLEGRVGERIVLDKLKAQGESLNELRVGNKEGEDEGLVYDLFAVDEHLGGLGGGHYRAYAKNDDDQQWYHYDDSHVSKARPEDSVNSNAYLLFYRRRTSRPIGGEQTLAKIQQVSSSSGAKSDDEAVPELDPSTSSSSFAIPPSSQRQNYYGPPRLLHSPVRYSARSGTRDSSDDIPGYDESADDLLLDTSFTGATSLPSPSSSSTGADNGDNDADADSDTSRRAVGVSRSRGQTPFRSRFDAQRVGDVGVNDEEDELLGSGDEEVIRVPGIGAPRQVMLRSRSISPQEQEEDIAMVSARNLDEDYDEVVGGNVHEIKPGSPEWD